LGTNPPPLGNSVLLLRPLAVVLGRLGVDGDRFLADVGVSADTPSEAYVPTVKVDRALDAIAAQRGDEAFGLTMAREALVRPLGLFGHLVWLSGTLRDALTRAAHFYSLVTQRSTLSLEIVDTGQAGRVATFTQRMRAGATRGNILTEFAFASLVLRARAAIGEPFRVRGMRFAHHARNPAPREYEGLFEAPVTFGAPLDELTLDASLLDLPLASADPLTAAAIEEQATQIRARVGPAPFVERLRGAVQADLRSDRPSLASVARRLGIGARSLRRQLEDQKLSLRAVVVSVRRDRATELLAGGASIKEVAFQLGFSEPSAFSRAYKRWTGRSPSGAPSGEEA
jgi:AraC-like DNA-binding protein